jgi:hypothetical protein
MSSSSTCTRTDQPTTNFVAAPAPVEDAKRNWVCLLHNRNQRPLEGKFSLKLCSYQKMKSGRETAQSVIGTKTTQKNNEEH